MKSNLSRYICCEKCLLKFDNRTVLNMHKRIVHKIRASRESFCEKCPLKFANRTVLDIHKRVVHKIKAKPIENEKNDIGVQQSLLIGKQTISFGEKKSSSGLKIHNLFMRN